MRAGNSQIKLLITLSLILFFICKPREGKAQLTVDSSLTPQQLVNTVLVGNGVSASNVTYTGATISLGKFTNGNTTNIGLDEGIIITTGSIFNAPGPNSAQNKTTNTLGGSDPQLAALVPGYSVNDAAVLEFDFVPLSDSLKLEYVFASEEYPEWVGSSYNDVFGFFISGPNPAGGTYSNKNLAIVPGTTLPVTVNNINNGPLNSGPCTNCNYYVNNTGSTIEYDGFTTVLKSCVAVTPCTTYHIKIAIGDVADHSFDSGIFLKSNSFSTNIVSTKVNYSNPFLSSHCIEGCSNAIVSFTLERPALYNKTVHFTIGGTATNGVDYTHIADSVVIPAGSDSVAMLIVPLIDNIAEGTETVQLIVATSSCSWDTVDINIKDYTAVSVNINSPPTVCKGDSAQLTAVVTNGSVPFTYSWNTGDSSASITKKINSQTTYIVNVTDYCNVTDADTVVVGIYNLPTISATANPATICHGDSSTLTVSGASTYNWSPASSLSSSNGSSVFAFPSATTTYTVAGTDGNGCKDTTQITLNVKPQPTITTTVASQNICKGSSTNITASGGISYQWAPSSSLNQNTGAIVIATPTTSTTYTVTGTGSNGCTNTATAAVNVYQLPTISFSPANPAVCLGQSKTLTASGAQTYSWSPSTYLSTTTGSTVITTPANTITYTVTGTDNHGCVNQDTTVVTVNLLPTVTASPFDTSICDNSSTVINAGGALTYSWSPATGLSSTTGSSVTASPASTITYSVIGTDANGCQDTATSHIVVSPSPVLTPNSQTICFGDNATITASSSLTGTSYLWNTGATTASITVSPPITTNYSVTATDTNGCTGNSQATVTVNPLPTVSINPAAPAICTGNNVQLTASGASNYTWSPATGLSSTTGSTVTANPTATTTYTVVGQSATGCYDTAYVTVTVNPLPNISVNHKDTVVCISSTFPLTASGGTTYSWSPSTYLSSNTGATVSVTPFAAITYIVTGTDANGCVNTDTSHIVVSPVITASASLPRICLGDSTQLSVTATGNCTFLWSTGNSQSSFFVKPTVTTSYTVTATDTMACSYSDTVNIIVDTLPIVTVSPHNPNLCNGSSVTLTASGATTYTWSPSTSLSGTTGSSVSANPTSTITYTVIGFTAQNCTDTAQTTINVIPSPTVTVSPEYDTVCYGQATTLSASGNVGGLTYNWSPVTGLSATTGTPVTATPPSSTNYKVVGTAPNGCKDSAYSHIYVNPLPVLVITPDTSNLCIGDSVSISASGAANYVWSPATSLSTSTGATVIAKPNSTTTYKIIGTSAAGCVDSTTAYVGIHPYPTVAVSPVNSHLCPNDSVKLIATGAVNYIWSPATGLNTTTNDTVIAKPTTTSTTYQVIGSTIYGCSDTASTIVTVSPLLQLSPASASICENDSVKLSVISNTSSSTFLWSTGATADTVWVSPNTTTVYTVTATDASTCTNTASVTVTVNAIPSLAVSPANPGVCPGDSVSITASGANTYTWSPSTTLTSSTGTTVKAFPQTTTTYSVIGLTTAGCKDTLDFQVTVYGLPTVSVNPASMSFCGGLTQTLIASGANTYLWSPATGLNTTTNDTVLATPSNSITYQVIGTDTNGCRDTAQSVLTVYSDPIITPIHPRICPGDTVKLNATGIPPLNWNWNTGATTQSINVTPTTTTTYSVTATYPAGCIKSSSRTVIVYNDPVVSASATDYSICPGDTAEMNALNCTSYSWTPTSTLLQTTGSQVHGVPVQNTTYTVTGLSIHNCPSTDTVNIQLYPQPSVTATASPYLICYGDSSTLSATGAQSYLWSPSWGLSDTTLATIKASPDSSETYQVTGTDTNGCKATDTVFLTIDHGPDVFIVPNLPVICQGDSVNLAGYGAVSYQWWPAIWMTNPNSQTTTVFPTSNITYNLRGFDNHGCHNDTSVYVTVKRNPVIWVFPPLDSICTGDSVRITATGAGGNGTYLWTPSAGLSSSIGDTIWASPAVNTTYKITGVSTDGCAKSVTSTIKVYPNPVVTTVPPTTAICINDTVSIKASGADNYQWSPAAPILSGANTDSITANPSATTDFRIIGTTIHGCKDTTFSHITVNPLPNVFITATDSAICIGDSTYIHGNGATTYQWKQNPTLFNPNSSTTKVIPPASTQYLVSGTDNNGCVNKDSFTVIVNTRPVIGIQPSASVVCSGNPVYLTGQSSMNPTTFIWNTGDTVNMLTAHPTVTTTYQVNGYNMYGCDDSATVTIQANPFPQISVNTTDTIICDYDSVNLIASSNINPVNFTWNTGQTTSSITVHPATNTTYSVIAADSIGCSDTIQSLVRIQPTPWVNVSSSKNPSCSGDSIVIAASASGAVVSYLWNNLVVMPSMNITPTTSGLYIVNVTDSIGCMNQDSIYQQVNPIPQMNITASANQICIGDTVQLSSTSSVNPVSFSWSTGQTTPNITTIPQTTTTYTVTGSDSISCSGSASVTVIVHNLPVISFQPVNAEICNGDTVTLTAQSTPQASGYQWSTGSTSQSIVVNPSTSTNYGIQITDIHNCKNTASKNVTVYPLPVVNVNPPYTGICGGDTVTLTATANHPVQAILWNTQAVTPVIKVNPFTTNHYWATITDTNSCSNTDTAVIQVTPRPTCTITAAPDTICSIDSIKVSYMGTGTPNALYNWNFDGGTPLSGSGGGDHWVQWNNGGFKIIRLTVTENGCTSYPDTAGVRVYKTPLVEFTAAPTEACESLIVNFSNNIPNIKSYFWQFGDPLTNSDTSTLQNPGYAYPYAGSYTVGLFVESNDGCQAYGYKVGYVHVHENPLADFGVYPKETSILKSNVSFWDFSDGAKYWLYDFGDPKSGVNNTSTYDYPWHEFKDTGLFNVRLVVTNEFGCTDTAWKQVRIKPFPQLYFPNAFSPDGDGLNDKFFVKGHDYDWETFHIYIYNRWGELVYESKDINEGWNGKMKGTGEDCPTGNYVFVIKVKDKDHHNEQFKGNIILLR